MATIKDTAPRYGTRTEFVATLVKIRDGAENLVLPTPNLHLISPALAKYLIEEINSWA